MAKKKKEKKEEQNEAVLATDSEANSRDELGEPLWSVISFEKCEAGGLTYDQATQKIAELEKAKVSGLCIVTDLAAARMTGNC